MAKTRVLFLCTGNSCWSQMAEGWLHWSFDDPAVAEGSAEARRVIFRQVRVEIRASIERFVTETGQNAVRVRK